jgi:hypothetical protein
MGITIVIGCNWRTTKASIRIGIKKNIRRIIKIIDWIIVKIIIGGRVKKIIDLVGIRGGIKKTTALVIRRRIKKIASRIIENSMGIRIITTLKAIVTLIARIVILCSSS